MRTATLRRTKTGDSGTFGELKTETRKSWASGELPWRNNARGASCIPAGCYSCRMQYSPAHGREVYTLQDVPCRTDVEIHLGNWCGDLDKGYRSDVMGCILLGMALTRMEGQDAVIDSKHAVAEFENEMQDEPFQLVISWADGINPESVG